MDLKLEKQRGEDAKAILNNPLWKEAEESIETFLSRGLRTYKSDPQALQEIALMSVVSDKYKKYFQDIADTGKLATIQLDKEA